MYDFTLCIWLALKKQVHFEVQQPFHVKCQSINLIFDTMKVVLFSWSCAIHLYSLQICNSNSYEIPFLVIFTHSHWYLCNRSGIFIYVLNPESITDVTETPRNISFTNLKFHNTQNISRILKNSIYITSIYLHPSGSTNNKLYSAVPWPEGGVEVGVGVGVRGECSEWTFLTTNLHTLTL